MMVMIQAILIKLGNHSRGMVLPSNLTAFFEPHPIPWFNPHFPSENAHRFLSCAQVLPCFAHLIPSTNIIDARNQPPWPGHLITTSTLW